VARAIHPGTAKRTVPEVVEVIKQLGPTMSNQDLVEYLGAAGLRTGSGRAFDIAALQWVRHAYKIPPPDRYAAAEISVAVAASRLGCSISTVYYWLKTGQLGARRGAGNRLAITWTDEVQAQCRRRIAESAHLHQRPTAEDPAGAAERSRSH